MAIEGLREPTSGRLGSAELASWLFFLTFLRRVDSLPLASERLGEPGRLRDASFAGCSGCLGRPVGVFVPLVEAPEGGLSDFALSLSLFSARALRSSSRRFSSSSFRFASSSESLCGHVSLIL